MEVLPKNLRALPEMAPHMAVIGGGDTSMDCLRTSKRLQTQHGLPDGVVTDYYRRTESEMPGAAPRNACTPARKGSGSSVLVAPVRFLGDEQGTCPPDRIRTHPAGSSGRFRSPAARAGARIELYRAGRRGDPGAGLQTGPAACSPDARLERHGVGDVCRPE